MDYDERSIMNEEARMEDEEFDCAGCGKTINGRAAIDPIIIDDLKWCDCCASNLVHLRMSGEIMEVSDKTKQLVKAVNDANYHRVWQQEFDKNGKVKHI